MLRLGLPPKNLLDLDLPGEIANSASWALTVERDGTYSSHEPGWSGSRHLRTFRGEAFEVVFDGQTAIARYDRAQKGAGFLAIQTAVFGALRREGRADLHASAVVPAGSSYALILVGESGHGKSTLTLRAIASGWGFLSDDLVAVFVDARGALTLSPLRRTLRISEAAVSLLPASVQGEWDNESPRKLIVDPEACGLGPRHSRARPHRLVFLERSVTRRILPMTSGEAFERLMLNSPHLTFDPDARPAIGALKRLADEVPARSAALPLDSLYDAATLEDLLA